MVTKLWRMNKSYVGLSTHLIGRPCFCRHRTNDPVGGLSSFWVVKHGMTRIDSFSKKLKFHEKSSYNVILLGMLMMLIHSLNKYLDIKLHSLISLKFQILKKYPLLCKLIVLISKSVSNSQELTHCSASWLFSLQLMAHTCPQFTSPHQNASNSNMCAPWVSGSVYSPHILSDPIKNKNTKWTLLTEKSNSLQNHMPPIQFTYQIILIYDLRTANRPSTDCGESAEGEMDWTRKIKS